MATPAAAGSQPSTLSTQLQALAGPSIGLPPAYLHPYAPSLGDVPWKGKGKADSIQSQLEAVRAMAVCIEQAKTQLSRRDGDWGKLSRALKEVVNHQNILLPLSTSLDQAFLRPSKRPLLPSSRIALPPVQLLPALAQSQDIQTYHEDSQFGLLKSTLTLAGNCFVVDIDLETDGASEEDEAGSTAADSGGSVRLSKIAVSYVTLGGGMAASEHIAAVLRMAIEAYLLEWNSTVDGLREKGDRGKRLEGCVQRIEGLLAEVKALDGTAQTEGATSEAGFAGLEDMAKRIEGLHKGGAPGTSAIYPTPHPTVYPSFSISRLGPTLRLWPAHTGENIPLSDGADAKWILEIPDGLVVRRNWLGGPEGVNNPWDGCIKVENLLYTPLPDSTEIHADPFPYQATFVHRPKDSLEQHWSLASPGPDGYVVGRLGLPESNHDLLRLLDVRASYPELMQVVRTQHQLNRMFQSVFKPDSILEQGDDTDENADMECLLAEPVAVPITVSHSPKGMLMEAPMPHDATLRVEISDPVRWTVLGGPKDGRSDVIQATEDLVKLFQAVLDERK